MDQLTDFFTHLFDYSSWPPRWNCGKWSGFHGWLYIISDLLIWAAYFAIPFIIIKYITKKHDAKFVRLYFLFASFILACGSTHFLDAIAFWFPLYRLSALMRFITSIISWVTVFYLYKLLPVAFSLKTAQQLEHEIEERKRAEEQNKEAEERYRLLVNGIQDYAIFMLDATGHVVNWNQGAKKIKGYAEDEVIGKHISIFYTQEAIDLGEPEHNLKMATQNGSHESESLRVKKDGSQFWANVVFAALFDGNKQLKGFAKITRDITEKKKLETELRGFNEDLEKKVVRKMVEIKEIFERVSDAFVALDENWNYTYVNDKAYENFDRPQGSLIGKNMWQEFPEGVGKPFYHAYKKAMETQQIIQIEEEFLPWGKWFENTVYPSPNGVSIYFKDITDKKKSEIRIRESEVKYRSLVEHASDAIFIATQEGKILEFNTSFALLCGYGKEELFGKDIKDILFEEDLKKMPLQVEKLFLENQLITERRIKRKNGSALMTEVSSTVLPNGNFMAVIRDITERREMEEQIMREKDLSDSIINSLPGLFYLCRNDGKFLRWNQNLETVSGYSTAEIIAMSPLDFFDTDEKQMINDSISMVFTEGQSQIVANLYSKKKKKTAYFFTGIAITYQNQECFLGIGIDLTEQKKAEEEALEIHREMYTALNRINDSVISVDNEWRYTFLNDAALTIHPLGREGTLGKTLLEVHPELEKTELWPKYQEVMKTKVAAEIESFYEPLNFWTSVKVYPSKDGLTFFYKDISERKITEEELKKSEEKYRLLFDNNPLPMWMIDVDTLNIIDVNEAAIVHYGYTRDEFMGMNIRNIRPAEDIGKVEEAARAHNNSIRKVGTWTHVKKDGTLIKVEITSHDVNYQNRKTRLILSNDITDKVKVEDALLKLNGELRELYARQQNIREEERKSIAREIHDELGQLLTGLKMDMSWLKKKIAEKQPELTEKMNETIGLLDESVKTIRKISSELRPGILDDLGIMDALLWLCKDFEKRTEIKCSIHNLAGNIECSDGTKVVLFRIFQETLTNVMRHAAATTVEAEISADKTTLTMQITDNGIGFDVTRNTKTLGLLGMKERIANINGQLYISSAVGRGTSITIIVPI